MKRSEINQIIRQAKDFFEEKRFHLPVWACWSPEEWKSSGGNSTEIIENQLGWDITDFGAGDFKRLGLVLFTLRNGNLQKKGKTYCEKIMISDENQEAPLHFHWSKTEDIINRGGGNLVMELFLAGENDELDDKRVEVFIDGVRTAVNPGEPLVLNVGQSICLEPRVYHRFYAQEGTGKTLIGEVSSVNDDKEDNHFYEEIGRFPAIEEDVPPLHLLVSDYEKYI